MRRLSLFLVLLLGLGLAVPSWAAAPAFQGLGIIAASTGADVTPPLPAHLADDVFLLTVLVRDTDDTLIVTGWTQLATVDRGVTARRWWFWRRALSGAEANPLVDKSTATGDTYAYITSYRGAETVGSPWDVVGTPQTGTTDPASITGITTTVADTLVIGSMSMEDNNNANVVWSATAPAAFQSWYLSSTIGTDGALDNANGTTPNASSGPTGTITANFNVANPVGWGVLVLALKGIAAGGGGGGAAIFKSLLGAGNR